MGNIASIHNMLKNLSIDSVISNDPREISRAEKLILPGVGSFDQGVEKMRAIPSMIESIKEVVLKKEVPFLGICLGMQLLMESSEEGNLPGLGFIPGKVLKFQQSEEKRTIHMGWNTITPLKLTDQLTNQFASEMRFYFVHGYYVKPTNVSHAIASTSFGIEFCSMVNSDNLWGVQFHPEKSHRFGQMLLKNFENISC